MDRIGKGTVRCAAYSLVAMACGLGACMGETLQAETLVSDEGDVLVGHCGTPDRLPLPASPSTQVAGARIQTAYAQLSERWPAKLQTLTYHFGELTGDLDAETIRRAFREGMDRWSAVAPIRFREVAADAEADMQISWKPDEHGDGFRFDRALAHAFPPTCKGERCSALSGDFHLSHGCHWQVEPGDGVRRCDLRHVVLHELGHVLGLDHSQQTGSVMRAAYNHMLELGEDDIAGIQQLYAQGNSEAAKADSRADGTAGGLNAAGDASGCNLSAGQAPAGAGLAGWMLPMLVGLLARRRVRPQAA